MQVPLLDLKLQYDSLKHEIRPEMEAIADSQVFIGGPKVEAFEKAVCDYTGSPHAIGVTSGTDALLVILMALDIGPGDAVITTPYTFFATAGSIARTGATPVFIDIDPATYNISIPKLTACLENECSKNPDGTFSTRDGRKIKAIMPVHLFGLCCQMDEILALARKFSLPVIEDAAQALGADYPSKNGTLHAGAIGDFGSYSFFPSKNLGAFGDAGMVLCRNEEMAVKIRALRNHGGERRYYHRMVGGNFRLDALQAAVLAIKLPHLDEWSAGRRRNAALYRELFAKAGLDSKLTLPIEPYAASGAKNHHIYNQFVIRAPRRDDLCAHLAKNNIGHAVYYPMPLHMQECFAGLGYREGDFPESEKAARESLALPIFPELTPEQQACVVDAIAAFYKV
ncbi:MAG TPA: DegT/DnrJ/EryC1/StrS family aminotransferase [Chthoniobacteraceae bacterium]|nr:DegT/DnrJ/EryC1/StrS family aminotransferase [Chthoniobacteraceae bacterium]